MVTMHTVYCDQALLSKFLFGIFYQFLGMTGNWIIQIQSMTENAFDLDFGFQMV